MISDEQNSSDIDNKETNEEQKAIKTFVNAFREHFDIDEDKR